MVWTVLVAMSEPGSWLAVALAGAIGLALQRAARRGRQVAV